MSCIVVNLMGGPGSGKSTAAAYIFSKLKMMGVNAELITEFAKDKVYEKNFFAIKNQIYIFAEQYYKLDCCKEQVDVIVTDSPIFLSIIYNQNKLLGESFNKTVVNVYNSFNNLTYFLNRVVKFNPNGRLQKDEREADLISQQILKQLKKYKIKYEVKDGNTKSCDEIINDVATKLKEKNLMR